mmetsp:Transcript_110445/g.235944  ORF Transcript_110445/g.235944 Transcript_110445/m.235944 type:complete len:662 (-) Transcript_110445:53-2038(-)
MGALMDTINNCIDNCLNNQVTQKFEKSLGADLDDVFSYSTSKVVRIRDRKLGIMHRFLILLIVSYVGLYQLMWKCRHMTTGRVHGSSRITLQRPTKDHCNPLHSSCDAELSDIHELPYCTEYKGNDPVAKSAQLPCEYFDEQMWNYGPGGSNSVLLPTVYRNITQHLSSTPQKNPWTFSEADHGPAVYIADIEDFTLLFDHSFISRDVGMKGMAEDFQAYWEDRSTGDDHTSHHTRTAVPSPCAGHACWKQTGREDVRPGEGKYKSLVSIGVGDVISIRDLLRLVGKPNYLDDLGTITGSEKTRREEGGVLLIDVFYENAWASPGSWFKATLGIGGQPRRDIIKYTYKAQLVNSKTFKHTYIERHNNQQRVLHDFHGLHIVVSIQGNLVAFVEWDKLLLVVTTSLTLLAVASLATDFVATKLLPLKVKFKVLKEQPTEDFSDYRRRIAFLQRAQKAYTKEAGVKFNPVQCRTSFGAMYLYNATQRAQDGNPKCVDFGILPSEADLLAILLNHERRMNRLDAHDEHFIHTSRPEAGCRDRLYEYLKEYRMNFEMNMTQMASAQDPEMDDVSGSSRKVHSAATIFLEEEMKAVFADVKELSDPERTDRLRKELHVMLDDHVASNAGNRVPEVDGGGAGASLLGGSSGVSDAAGIQLDVGTGLT